VLPPELDPLPTPELMPLVPDVPVEEPEEPDVPPMELEESLGPDVDIVPGREVAMVPGWLISEVLPEELPIELPDIPAEEPLEPVLLEPLPV
jgi:hypothetical protein